MKLLNALLILVLLVSFHADAFANGSQCNELLSGLSVEVVSSIHDLAKLRFDLDQRVARGDDDLMIRMLEAQYLTKEKEILDAAQISHEVLLAKVRAEVEAIQNQVSIENSKRVQTREETVREIESSKVSKSKTIGTLKVPRHRQSAISLPDGTLVLVGGGKDLPLEVEQVDPKTGNSTLIGNKINHRKAFGLDLIHGNQLLLTGGVDTKQSRLRSIEIFDLKTGVSRSFGKLIEARNDHTTTVLADGRILVIGGYSSKNAATSLIEAIDPQTGESTRFGKLKKARFWHQTTVLDDGNILVVGGSAPGAVPAVEIIDVQTGKSKVIGHLKEARALQAQTLLPNGKLLISGGYSSPYGTNSIELFDLKTGKSEIIGHLSEARVGHQQSLLPDGRVVITGGYTASTASKMADLIEVIDPATGEVTESGTLIDARKNHAQIVRPNGEILVAGGEGLSDEILSIESIKIGRK